MTPCNLETFKKILNDLGEDWTEKLIKLRKKSANTYDKQAQVHMEVAEVYSPPRMTKMVDMMVEKMVASSVEMRGLKMAVKSAVTMVD